MGRHENDESLRNTKRKSSTDDSIKLNTEDEEAIRAKLRETGWKKDKPHTENGTDKNDKDGEDGKRDRGRDRDRDRDGKRGGTKDRDRDDRDRKSSRHRSRRSRSSRRARSDRDRRRNDRDRDRGRDRDRDRSQRRRGRSRSISISKSRSRSPSRSRTKHRESRGEKRGRSRSESHGSTKSSRSPSKAKRSRRSSSPLGKSKEEKIKSPSKPKEKSEKKTETNGSSSSPSKTTVKTKEGSPIRNDKEKNDEESTKDEEEDKKKSKREGRDRSKTRKSSRRSRSTSRSVSRSRRHHRRRSSRSRSRSASRSRRHRDRDRDRRRRSRTRSTSRRRSPEPNKKKRRDANSSPEPHDHPLVAAAAGLPVPGLTSNVASNPIAQLLVENPGMSIQEMMSKMQASQATAIGPASLKPARELYVGNLPPTITGPQLQEFLGTIIQQVGLCVQPGNPIITTWISVDGHFAFCEMRSVEECNLALLLNQLPLLGQPLKFGRPKSFVGPPQPMPFVSARTQTALANLGCTPNPQWFAAPSLDMPSVTSLGAMTMLAQQTPSLVGLPPPITLGEEDSTSNVLMMSNIPVMLTEDQVKELVQPFGDLKAFSFVKDTTTGQPTGTALFEYIDSDITPEAKKGLDGLDLGGIALSVRRAPVGVSADPVDEKSSVVKLANMVTVDDLKDDEEFAELKEDVEEECTRFGKVVSMVIPRPVGAGGSVPGIGNIYVRFENTSQAQAAMKALNGRKFGGNVVQVTYFSVNKFESKDFA